MDNTRLADALWVGRTFGTADARQGFLDARQVFRGAGLVDLQAIDLLGVEVDFHMPVVAATAFGKDDVLCETFFGDGLVPDEVDPCDMVSVDVGKTYILAGVFL